MSEPNNWNADGPIVVWTHHSYEGWSPRSYPALKDALLAEHDDGVVLTRRIDFEVTETPQASKLAAMQMELQKAQDGNR